MVQLGCGLNQVKRSGVPCKWVLLDSCSTNNVFNNCKLLKHIVGCTDEECLHLTANDSSTVYSLISSMKIFPLRVHFNKNSLANVISLFDLIKVEGIHITMDNKNNYGFHITFQGKLYYFSPFENRIYFFNTCKEPRIIVSKEPRSVGTNTNTEVSSYSLLQSIKDNKTDCEIKGSENA